MMDYIGGVVAVVAIVVLLSGLLAFIASCLKDAFSDDPYRGLPPLGPVDRIDESDALILKRMFEDAPQDQTKKT